MRIIVPGTCFPVMPVLEKGSEPNVLYPFSHVGVDADA